MNRIGILNMKMINILHLSDFHGCIREQEKTDVDYKDKSIEKKFVEKFLPKEMPERFIKNLKNIVNNTIYKIDSIIFSGDLGDKGDKDKIAEGMDFLMKIASEINVDKEKIVIIPGNHDLNQDAKNTKDLLSMFIEQCKTKGINNYINSFNPLGIKIKGLQIIALNSCIGNNVKILDFLPDNYYKNFIKKISKEIEEIKIKYSKFKEVRYQMYLDIPGLGIKQVETLFSLLSKNNSDISVITLHHNPVQSKIQEIRPYSNLIDGGYFIKRLAENKNFFLYYTDIHIQI